MGLYTRYTKQTDQAAVDATKDGTTDKIVGFLTAPISFKEDVLVTEKTQAISVLGWGTAMFFVGELIGHRRAATGGQALLPFGRP